MKYQMPRSLSLSLVTLCVSGLLVACSGSGVVYESPGPAEMGGIVGATDLYNRAQRYYEDGKYEMAKESFHEYINNYPETELYKVALYYLGHSHHMLNENADAHRLYTRVIEEFPANDFWVERAKRRIDQLKDNAK